MDSKLKVRVRKRALRMGGVGRIWQALLAQRVVITVCLFNIVISLVSTCFFYSELYHLQSFPLFSNQLNAFISVVVPGVALIVMRARALRRGDSWDWLGGVALWKWAQLGALFSLQNTLDIASIDGLGDRNSNLPPVFSQACIPVTMALSRLKLGKEYSIWHYVGACVVVGGILLSYLPLAVSSSSSVPVGWACLFLMGRLPQSMANVQSEAVLDRASNTNAQQRSKAMPEPAAASGAFLLLVHFTFWTSIFSLPFNFIYSLILSAIPGVPFAINPDYANGWSCVFAGTCDGTKYPDIDCSSAWLSVVLFAIPGVLFSASEFQVLQHAGAAVYFILLAVELPLQALMLASPYIMGSMAGESHISIIYGIALLLPGLLLYGWAELQSERSVKNARDSDTNSFADSNNHLATAMATPLLRSPD